MPPLSSSEKRAVSNFWLAKIVVSDLHFRRRVRVVQIAHTGYPTVRKVIASRLRVLT